MKFTCTADINLPADKTAELFDNKNTFKNWQEGFQSYEHLSGTPNQPGAKAKIIVKNGNRVIELTETIITYDPPREISALYEHIHMTNTARHTFTAISTNQTRLESEINYTRFNGIMPKLMALLMPGFFKKQAQKWLDNFKRYAEGD